MSEIYQIRGHHLDFYQQLVLGTKSFIVASRIADSIESHRQDALKRHYFVRNYHIYYGNDVIGDSSRKDEYQNSLEQTYERFLALSPQAPVMITAGTPDEMCRACAIGSHCKRMYNWTANLFQQDQQMALDFLTKAKSMGLDSGVQIINTTVNFLDAPSTEAKIFRTTADTVRKVLASTDQPVADTISL